MINVESDFVEAIAALKRERGLTPSDLLCEAIRCGDAIDTTLHVNGPSTLGPKKEAILAGRRDVLKMLLKNDNTVSEELVATACERKDSDAITMLLDSGWPINEPVYSMASLLCCTVNDVDLTQWLIDKGADVNSRSRLDEPALSIAIVHGSMDVVRLLLVKGTDITHGNLLHCAAERKNKREGADLVEYLIEKGADPNAYRHDNPVALRFRGMSALLTPLHVACNERNAPVARALLQHGADPHRQMLREGSLTEPTPLNMAQRNDDKELVNLLVSTSACQ